MPNINTEITTTIPIPDGYEFVRIDNKIKPKERYINSNMVIGRNINKSIWVSDYLWIIVKKIKVKK